MKKKLMLGAILTTAAIALSGCAGAESAPPVEKGAPVTLNVGVSPTTSGTGFYAALKGGYFDDENITVVTKVMQSGSQAIPLLINGEVQFSIVDIPGTAVANEKGLPIRLVIGVTHTPEEGPSTDGVIVKEGSDIKRPRDLEGRTVAVSSLVSTPALYLRAAVEQDGGDPAKVKLVEVPQANTVAVVEDGTVDAGMIFEPFLAQGVTAGLRVVTHPGQFAAPGAMQSAYGATEDYLAKHPDIAKRFISAIQKGNADIVASVDGDRKFLNELVKSTTSIDPEVVDVMVPPSYRSGGFSADAANIMLNLMFKYDYLKTEIEAKDIMWDGLE